jgi:hypothetical protein
MGMGLQTGNHPHLQTLKGIIMAKKSNAEKVALAKKAAAEKAAAEKAAKPTKKVTRAKVRLVSENPKYEGLWVRAFVDVIEAHGVPLDPGGKAMVPGKAPRGGLSAEQRAARKAEKEAEKAKFDAMSDEEKLAFAKAKREAKKAKREAKKAAERNALIAQIKAEIKAGTISLD